MSVFLATSVLVHASPLTDVSVSRLTPEIKTLFIDALAASLPEYIRATEGALKEIDALAPGLVRESTRLDLIPIKELFERYEALYLAKSKIWEDTDFSGGRSEHDVAWLRNSLKELTALLQLARDAQDGKNVDGEIDKNLVNFRYYYTSLDNFELAVDWVATSRFYCNAGVRIFKDASRTQPAVSAQEYCD